MDDEARRRVPNRLKSIEGHVRGVQKMVEEDRYCIDIHQAGPTRSGRPSTG